MRQGEEGVLRPYVYIEKNLTEKDVLGFDFNVVPFYMMFKIMKDNKIKLQHVDIYSVLNPRELHFEPVREYLECQISVKEKLEKVRSFGERIAVYSLLEDIMWLFNLRGSDIKMCPVAFSYAIVTQTNAYLFIGTKEMYQEIGKYKQLQEANVEVMPYHEFFDTAKVLLREKQIVCDFYSISVSIQICLIYFNKSS